jgi:hypothetical protein
MGVSARTVSDWRCATRREAMLGLLTLAVVVLMILALPLLLLRLAFKLVFALVFLPFKLLGLVLKIAFGVVGLVFRVLFSGVGLVFGLLAAVFFLVMIPLLPFVLLGLGLWLLLREARPSRRALHVA